LVEAHRDTVAGGVEGVSAEAGAEPATVAAGTESEAVAADAGRAGVAGGRAPAETRAASAERHRPSKVRLAALAVVALLPSFLKRPAYRLLFGYRIGRGVRVGLTILDARRCTIEDDVKIGHLNVVIGVGELLIRDHAEIGHLNVLRGGREIRLGRYSQVLRMNEINSIPDPEVVNPIDPVFTLGDGAVVTAGHKIDFTDRVEIGRRSILGGRNSSLWTHNRQRTRPVRIGELSYVGSEIRVAPGGVIPSRCIVGIGAVVTSQLQGEHQLIGGVPARAIKQLSEEDRFLIEHKTRPDLPDDI
jgi:acetyltransferase-like isoleucine patch superfamily enzyme